MMITAERRVFMRILDADVPRRSCECALFVC
jgi:hypothetical protein